MRFGLLGAILAAKGCVPDLDRTEHKPAYLIGLGACALAVLLLVVLRAFGGDGAEDEDPPDRDPDP